jgi:hypothetical protein
MRKTPSPLTDAVAELLLATARRRRERLAAEVQAEQQNHEGEAPRPAA